MYRVILTHFEDQEWLQDPTQAQSKQVGGCASTSKQRKAPRQGQLRACTKVRDELMDGMKSTCQVNKELGASALYIMTLHCTICEIIDEGAVGVLIRTTRKRYHTRCASTADTSWMNRWARSALSLKKRPQTSKFRRLSVKCSR